MPIASVRAASDVPSYPCRQKRSSAASSALSGSNSLGRPLLNSPPPDYLAIATIFFLTRGGKVFNFGSRYKNARHGAGPPCECSHCLYLFLTQRRRTHASPTLFVLRRPLPGGTRFLSQGIGRRGDETHALQGQSGACDE